jgi:hypothetical protein
VKKRYMLLIVGIILLAVPLLGNGYGALFKLLSQAGFTEAKHGIMQSSTQRMNNKCSVTQTLTTNDHQDGDPLENISRISRIERSAIEAKSYYVATAWNPPVGEALGFYTIWFAVDPSYCLKPPPTGMLPVLDIPPLRKPSASSIVISSLALVLICVLWPFRKRALVGLGVR